jgi:hypothetical protein
VQTTAATGGKYVVQLQGQPGIAYQLQTSTDLTSWSSNTTVTLADTTWSMTNSLPYGARFWRAVWQP